MIPSRPNCVVDTEEHNHVLAVNKSLGTNQKRIYVIFLLRCIKVHDLHGPQGENIFFVKEDPSLLRMLHPLHCVDEGDWPLVRDSRGVHGARARADGESGLRTEIRLVGTWLTSASLTSSWD